MEPDRGPADWRIWLVWIMLVAVVVVPIVIGVLVGDIR